MLKNFRDMYNEGDQEEFEDFEFGKCCVFLWEVVFVLEEFFLVFFEFVEVFFFAVSGDECLVIFVIELCDFGIFIKV